MKHARVLLSLAILVALGAAGAAGFRVWRARERARKPTHTLKVDFGGSGVNLCRFVRELSGPPFRFAGEDTLVVAQETDGKPRARSVARFSDYACGAWSIDDGKLAHALDAFPDWLDPFSTNALRWSNARELEFVDVATGLARALPGPRPSHALAAAPDVIAMIASGDVIEVRSRDGKLVRTLPLPGAPDEAAARARGTSLLLSPTGDRLAAVWHLGIFVCKLSSGTWCASGTGAPLGFAPSGLVVLAEGMGSDEQLTLARVDGSEKALSSKVRFGSHRFALAASGERLAVFDRDVGGKVAIKDVETTEVLREVPVARSDVCGLALAPDGDRLAIAYDDGVVEVWEVP